MKDEKEQTVQIEEKDKSRHDQSTQTTDTSEKPVYKKPQLKKYTQIDYVSAYGVGE